MKREIGRWNKATGITKPIEGQQEWVELWVGDVIECRVYITNKHGCYLRITGEILWDKDYGMYIINGKYRDGGEDWNNFFPLHKIVNDNVVFLKKVSREFGSQRDIIFHIVEEMKRYQDAPNDGDMIDAMNAMVNRICDMGVVPKEEIMTVFNGE